MYLFLYHEKGEATKTNFQCLDSTDLHIKRSALPIFQSVHTFLWSMFTGNKILYYQLMDSMDQVVSTAEVCRKFWKFPFMTAKSFHIGPCMTKPSCRGRGYYPYLLQQIIKDYPRNDFFMIVDEKNKASIRGVTKAGLQPFAKGIKNKFGQYVITERLDAKYSKCRQFE